MNASPPPPDAAAASADLAQLHALMRARDFAAALTAGEAVLAASPTHRDARLLVAIAQRYLGRTADALRTLATLQQQYPRFSRLYEERGRCYVELRQAPEAIQAFLTAVNLNHALPGSWSMLEGLYRMTGEAQNEAMAGSHVATLKKIPADIVAATAFFMDGNLMPHMEFSHLEFRKGETFNEQVGEAARKKIGDERWNKRVRKAIAYLNALTFFDHLYIGGGNGGRVNRRDLGELLERITVVDNKAGILGGIKLWDAHHVGVEGAPQ